jgi:hypothetical protein
VKLGEHVEVVMAYNTYIVVDVLIFGCFLGVVRALQRTDME